MTQFEYKVIPAPSKGRKAPGVKGAEARFAHGLEEVMNELGAEGWHYLRSDLLPSEERQGLTSSQTIYRSVLVFQRPRIEHVVDEAVDEVKAAPQEPDIEPETAGHDEIEIGASTPEEPAPDVDPVPPRLA
ncbi:hypothetical protein [Roseovarius sp. 2305UL8-3]|uniref:hypothetical protein n=1 Tax=Roseovarius conchicola TaxID=3121636 RepID=UPI003526DC50